MNIDFFQNINAHPGFLYIAIRCVLLFLISVLLICYGNRRYQLNTTFDYLLLIIIGSLISRGINGNASFLSTVVSLVSLIICHRLIAIFTYRFDFLEPYFKGKSHLIIKNGKVIDKQLQKLHLTEKDVLTQLRHQLHLDNLMQVRKGYLENSGMISFLLK